MTELVEKGDRSRFIDEADICKHKDTNTIIKKFKNFKQKPFQPEFEITFQLQWGFEQQACWYANCLKCVQQPNSLEFQMLNV